MHKYNVYLWSGAGYELTPFLGIEAYSEQEAVEIAVAKAEENGWEGLFWDDCEDLSVKYEFGEVLYIDATMHGASKPHYIDCTELRVEEIWK